jgi:hypothetical protein
VRGSWMQEFGDSDEIDYQEDLPADLENSDEYY